MVSVISNGILDISIEKLIFNFLVFYTIIFERQTQIVIKKYTKWF